MNKYNRIDLVRFHRVAIKNPELKPIDLIKKYDELYPRLTNNQVADNLKKALKENGL